MRSGLMAGAALASLRGTTTLMAVDSRFFAILVKASGPSLLSQHCRASGEP
jgi:hypothetical protein